MANKLTGGNSGKGRGTGAINSGSSSTQVQPALTTTTTNISGPRFGVPPRIIGEPVRLYRRSVLEWFAILVGIVLAATYLTTIPFPDALLIRLALGAAIVGLSWAYVGLPVRANKTTLEWSIIYLASLFSNIPRHTRARDSFGGSGSAATNRYASPASLSASYLREQQGQPSQKQGQPDQGNKTSRE